MVQLAAGSRGDDARQSGRSVRLFLADGTPEGVVIAGIGNWSGKALSAPRSRLPQLLVRPECSKTGVYVLLGPDPERSAGTLAYVGEADDIAARLRIHLRSEKKDFFDRLVVVVSSDDSLTKAHVRYLESQIIRLARAAEAVVLTNDAQPDFQRLPEADRVDMDYFVAQLRLVLPILRCDLFRRAGAEAAAMPASPATDVFAFSTAGASATARETDDGFVVLAGSTARRQATDTFPAGYEALRDQLVRDGRLTDGPTPELFRFASDVAFASPSAAASIVAARSVSGPLEWKLTGGAQS
ncbi:MAG: GIY-YIG nuclease family protein, partial [Gammaproteobacteria bacterium]